jgi:hypothetical protein
LTLGSRKRAAVGINLELSVVETLGWNGGSRTNSH